LPSSFFWQQQPLARTLARGSTRSRAALLPLALGKWHVRPGLSRDVPPADTKRQQEHLRAEDMIEQLIKDESGQDVVEYGLLIATIAIVVLIATAAFGSNIGTWFNTLAGRITTTGTQ
jgi:pilus assembly protein Flp/PilA